MKENSADPTRGRMLTAHFAFYSPQYNLGFYLQYMAIWPNYVSVCESASKDVMGYSM